MRGTAGHDPKADPPDEVVVARIRNGDREAYRVLVRRYQDLLYRHALRLTKQADVAADMVQAALVKGFERLSRCRDPERFGAWLFRILVNGCKDHLKSPRRRDASLERDRVPPTPAPADPSEDLERAELRSALELAVEQLPEAQRVPFLLKHVEGRSYEEISEMLEISVPALKMRVHRAREALRTTLQEVV